MGRGFPSRRNIWHKGQEVREDEGFQDLKAGPQGWVTEYMERVGQGMVSAGRGLEGHVRGVEFYSQQQ